MKILETIFICFCILTLLAIALGQTVPLLVELTAAVHIFCSHVIAVLGLIVIINRKANS